MGECAKTFRRLKLTPFYNKTTVSKSEAKSESYPEMGIIRPYEALVPKETPPEKRIWEDPDPRVQWALDILEPPGKYGQPPEKIQHRFGFPIVGAAAGSFLVATSNILRRVPTKSNVVGYAAMTIFGIYLGEKSRLWNLNYRAEELATIKHYIMLHPEKFPEPEHMKYGDKRVFYPWFPNRRPGVGGQY